MKKRQLLQHIHFNFFYFFGVCKFRGMGNLLGDGESHIDVNSSAILSTSSSVMVLVRPTLACCASLLASSVFKEQYSVKLLTASYSEENFLWQLLEKPLTWYFALSHESYIPGCRPSKTIQKGPLWSRSSMGLEMNESESESERREERGEKREERRDEGERIVLPTLGMQFKGEWEERGFCARQESSAVWPFDYLTETTCQYIWSSCFVLGRNPQHLSVQSHTAMEAFHFEKATIYLWQSRGPYSVGAHPAIPWNCQLLLPHLTGVATVGWGTDAYHTPHDPRYN